MYASYKPIVGGTFWTEFGRFCMVSPSAPENAPKKSSEASSFSDNEEEEETQVSFCNVRHVLPTLFGYTN